MPAAESRLHDKNFAVNELKFNTEQVSSVIFLGYFVSKERIAPDPKNVEKNRKWETIIKHQTT